jgi:hypothetical protein
MSENPSGAFSESINDEDVWQEVYVEQSFDFSWPTIEEPVDPPTDPPTFIISTVIAVSAASWPDVTFDLIGVRGAYRFCALFPPVINFVTHEQYAGNRWDYLYEYLANQERYKLIPYACTYSNGKVVTYVIRVWNDYTIGRDWIIRRIAYEQARDAAQEAGSALPAPVNLLCHP